MCSWIGVEPAVATTRRGRRFGSVNALAVARALAGRLSGLLCLGQRGLLFPRLVSECGELALRLLAKLGVHGCGTSLLVIAIATVLVTTLCVRQGLLISDVARIEVVALGAGLGRTTPEPRPHP